MAWTEPDPTDPLPRCFVLMVLPETLLHPWSARLRSSDGVELRFDSPIELMRHLVQIGQPRPPAGGLR